MASFDPLAGSQIDVDPSLKPKDADLAKKRAELIQRFLNAGATQEQAEAEADRLIANHPVIYGQQAAATAPQAPAAPAAPVAPPVSKKSHANLGRTWGGARDFESEEDRDNYQARRTLTPAEKVELRAQGMTEADMVQMQMSQQDIDMLDSGVYGAGQGWVPVYDPMTGRQTFKQRAPKPVYDGQQGEVSQEMGGSEAVTGNRRIGQRVDNRDLPADLQNPELEGAGYSIVQWEGPNGPEYIYHMNRPGDAGKFPGSQMTPRRAEQLAQYDAVYENRQLQRIAASAGVDPAEAEAAFEKGGMDAVRKLANTSRTRNQQDRMKRFQAQIQLGGGRLSPQAIQLETLLNGMDPEQRQRAMQYMAPGGALAAQVDARNLEAAAGLARNAVVGVLGQQNNPMADIQMQTAEAALPLPQRQKRERDRNGGTLPANSPTGVETLQDIEDRRIGIFAGDRGVDMAIEDAVAAGIPRPDAEAYFNRFYSGRRKKGEPPAEAPPGAPSSANPPPGTPPMPRSRPF